MELQYLVATTILVTAIITSIKAVWPDRPDFLLTRERLAILVMFTLLVVHMLILVVARVYANTAAVNPSVEFLLSFGVAFLLAGITLSKADIVLSKLAILDAKMQELGKKIEQRDRLVDYEK